MAFDVLAHANSFTRTTSLPQQQALLAGQPLSLQLSTDQLVGSTSTVEVIQGAVDLGVVLRHAELPDMTSDVPDGAWPHEAVAGTSTLTGTTSSVTVIVNSGLSAAPTGGGVEGWIGRVNGLVPVGFRELQDPVHVQFRWRVFRSECGDDEVPPTEFAVASGALDASAVTLSFAPEIAEWTPGLGGADALAATKTVYVQSEVRVRLATSGADSGWVQVPPARLPVPLKPIAVPSVAAMFRNSDFGGDAALLLVPEASPFESASALQTALGASKVLLDAVPSVPSAPWNPGLLGLVAAVGKLVERIPAVKHLSLLHQDKHDDLGKHNFIERWGPNTDMEDRTSSVVVVSPTRAIRFFEHDDRGGKRLTVTPSSASPLGGVVLRNLHVASPQSIPPGAVTTTGTPGEGSKWGDVISSYQWA